MKTFGERLKSARAASKLSQTEVSRRIGISQPLLSELEGNRYPTSGFTIQLASLYRVNPLWLAEGVGLRDLSESQQISEIGSKYLDLPPAQKALIDVVLSPDEAPAWLTPAARSAINHAIQVIQEQIPKKT